jgi:hypothetical protein
VSQEPRGRAAGDTNTLRPVTYSHFIVALMEGGCTRQELHERTGLGIVLVCKLVKALRTRGRLLGSDSYNAVLHIDSWKPDARGYPTQAAFRLGPGVDAPQPKKTRAEIVRTYLERKKLRQQQEMTA